MRRTTFFVAAAAVAASIGCAGQAHGAPASTVHDSIVFPVQTFDDPDVCASEGFTVHVVEHETLLFNFRYDADGNFAGGFAHHDISFALSGNGMTIHESDHYNNFFAPDGTSVAAGNQTHIIGAHGIVLLDAGRIVFDANGDPTFLAGQHPQFLGATFCEALTP